MILSSFRIQVLLRIALLLVLIGMLAAVLFRTGWVMTPVILGVALVICVAELIHYVEKTNRDFSDFLLSIKGSDFSKFSEEDSRGSSFSRFRAASNTIIDAFHDVRIDKEAHYTFLKAVVEQVGTAIIAFKDDGTITLMNDAAKKMIGISLLGSIKQLQYADPALYRYLTAGKHEVLELNVQGQQLKILARSTVFTINGVANTLILIQNVTTEIERTETEAWEQLLHVLTHEIMNSITPISSLSATIKSKVDEWQLHKQIDDETIEDMSYGLQVIGNRSTGLMNFVHHYKSLINLPAPFLAPVLIASLFERLQVLTEHRMREQGIALHVHCPADAVKQMDENLVEQVLINLLNNACDALAGQQDAIIELVAEQQGDILVTRVGDNGPGIERDLLSKIFIPFYTTKKLGTGIGLSLSRQIMVLHHGTINVQSAPGKGTVFTLIFP
ncbi:MAG: ATP-binding protein [Sphingobacteriales bacterium]|nr:MAG: ATP-binding protein [Sphingobacteriales bacterium]